MNTIMHWKKKYKKIFILLLIFNKKKEHVLNYTIVLIFQSIDSNRMVMYIFASLLVFFNDKSSTNDTFLSTTLHNVSLFFPVKLKVQPTNCDVIYVKNHESTHFFDVVREKLLLFFTASRWNYFLNCKCQSNVHFLQWHFFCKITRDNDSKICGE